MKVFHDTASMQDELSAAGEVGFVPTMGSLHEGHLSLVRKSIEENRRTVVSIFVNPRQFSPGEDLERYPRDIEGDCAKLESCGAEFLFVPRFREIYPEGFVTSVAQTVLGDGLCGRSRSGHFQGVLTVVAVLFGIINPDRAYFGQKDAQQAVMIKRMIRDLHMGIQLCVQPIVRDEDGLAMSSRNQYLSPEERRNALNLPRALEAGRRSVSEGESDAHALRERILAHLQKAPGLDPEYVETVSLRDLQPLERIEPENTLVAAAVRVGNTRLIDNFILGDI